MTRRCMHAVKPLKKDGGRFRKRNDQLMDSTPKERLQLAQVTLTGLQLVLQELVSAQQQHLLPDATDEGPAGVCVTAAGVVG